MTTVDQRHPIIFMDETWVLEDKYLLRDGGWRKDGALHHEDDLPAFIGADGRQQGRLYHGRDKPSIVTAEKIRMWRVDDGYHRVCGPAIWLSADPRSYSFWSLNDLEYFVVG